MKILYQKLNEINEVAKKILTFANESANEPRVWWFEGEMGAGKTTLIKALCHELGVKDTVQSPTFSVVNEYQTTQGKPIYHFDFYRLNNAEEALDLGYEEYFYSGNYCFVEWGSKIEDLFPPQYLKISITPSPEGRVIDLRLI
ncbi:MAG: tRNA (adenosine(37)-N6)-threonylcarbamoyltransferase complex ATPase subunit type 1 TsaE [Microscillaceae bacterium]|jgi:tRNA threonylcarbamoyladenosine biosynthesis protein TsaE|nr:tRNA (adenosine(37)-N6)-threonylcarbamoyltransferase complex ATPase subunit type 1 TsaE [Microscillaceae bacterium]